MSVRLIKLGQPAKPPYHVRDFPIGSAVFDETGYNVLTFTEKPGAKFCDRATCERIIDELRNMGH